MNEQKAFIHLKLRQARRAERPYTLFKLIILVGMISVLCGVVSNCGGRDKDKVSPAQQKKAVVDLWAGNSDAQKKRLP